MTFSFFFSFCVRPVQRGFKQAVWKGKKAFCAKIICSCSATAVIMSITVATGETALIKRKDRVTHKPILKALPAQKQRYKQQQTTKKLKHVRVGPPSLSRRHSVPCPADPQLYCTLVLAKNNFFTT